MFERAILLTASRRAFFDDVFQIEHFFTEFHNFKKNHKTVEW